jgi:hypothetical protein
MESAGIRWKNSASFHPMKCFFSAILVVAVVVLSGCAGGSGRYEEPLPRTQYQKVNVMSYFGAESLPGQPPATARGTRYQSGSVSSAAADWSRWPSGTLFRVLATGELYEVDDFTDDVVGTNQILLYKPSVARIPTDATHFVTIEVLRWGSPRTSAAILEKQKSSTARKILADLKARYPQR